jgi:hypothetical protein
VLRQLAQAGAPLLFGVTADALGGHSHPGASAGADSIGGAGLEYAFLIMLVPLAASGLIVWMGRKTYGRDVATAAASEEAVAAEAQAEQQERRRRQRRPELVRGDALPHS